MTMVISYPDRFVPWVSVFFALVVDDFGNEIELDNEPYGRARAFGQSGEVH